MGVLAALTVVLMIENSFRLFVLDSVEFLFALCSLEFISSIELSIEQRLN